VPDAQITVCSRSKARRLKRRGFLGVLSIENPGQRNGLRFHQGEAPDHLVLSFEDLDFAADGYAVPQSEHVEAILDFGRRHVGEPILIHCNAGVARSPAAALAILLDRYGPGGERQAFEGMYRIVPFAVPNRLMVEAMEKVQNRPGLLLPLLEEWEHRRAWPAYRREVNRRAVMGERTPFQKVPRYPETFEALLADLRR
jgi:predicted protein tyrosine phosphatase